MPQLHKFSAKQIHAPWLASMKDDDFVLGRDYPAPIVAHDEARKKTLARYQAIGAPLLGAADGTQR